MNNLTEQEAFNVADFINSYLFTAIKQDGMDDMEWLARMVSAYKKLSTYSDYNNPYANETKEDESNDNPWESVYWRLTENPMFRGIYDAKNESEGFMNGICTVMSVIATQAGKYNVFNSMFEEEMRRSQKRAGEFKF